MLSVNLMTDEWLQNREPGSERCEINAPDELEVVYDLLVFEVNFYRK